MFLKSLELNGFKSFAQKTVLEFPKGITAIVGPNGSGKSNIIDAVRWLLGERDAKNIRGEKMENLIFAGTPKKPKMGMASVGLFFNNGSGFFPIDFSEISIVRKVARDGLSQYFLNKSETKFREIVDFFARARLGTKGLAIINQGSSDLFVRVTSEERKMMIEEVLGLREFQIKKNEGERKLKNTFINLEKVKAMVEEVIPRLKILKRQVGKWEKRAEIAKELKELEDIYFSFKIGKILKAKRDLEPQTRQLSNLIGQKNGELKVLEINAKKLEEQSEHRNLNEIKTEKSGLLNKNLELQKQLSRLETKLEILGEDFGVDDSFAKEEILNLVKSVKNSLEESLKLGESGEIAKAIEDLIKKIAEFLNQPKVRKNQELGDLEKSKEELIKEAGVIESKIKKLEAEESEITIKLEEFNKNFHKAFEELENKKEEIRKLSGEKQTSIFEAEKLDIQLGDLESQLMAINRTLKEFSFAQDGVENQRNADDLTEMERRMMRFRAELASIGEIDESLVKEAEETNKHYNFLSNQMADLEAACKDLKDLIKELKRKIHDEFNKAFHSINESFNKFFRLMFEGGHAKLKIKNYELSHAYRQAGIKNDSEEENDLKEDNKEENEEEQDEKSGVEIELGLPKKKITNLEMLSGGEKSLVSIAALFALISVSPPPFLVLDEIDAALDEKNSRRFSNLIKEFAHKTQFIIVTHNRALMEVADVLYGVTMNEDGTSKLLSLKLDN
ncbi:MAG: AAA family ATPase [Patescibacteria group bacterium]